MTALYIALGVIGGILILYIAAGFIFAAFINKKAFGSRCDKNPLLKYFTAEDFSLKAEEVEIPRKGGALRGFLYSKEGVERNGRLAVFCHGMGPGHIAYTTEIAYFCGKGFDVLAVDYGGCGLSDGKSIRGLYGGTEGALEALNYAAGLQKYRDICLIGHSWGGYAALTAAEAATKKSDKNGANAEGATGATGAKLSSVVAISAPDSPADTVLNVLSSMVPKAVSAMLSPFVKIVVRGRSAAKSAEKCGVPVLLVYGGKDGDVPPENSAFTKAEGGNITKLFCEEKRHNPYNTVRAEEQLARLTGALAKLRTGETAPDFFSSFDYAAATEEDGEVMNRISAFLTAEKPE